MTRKFIIFLFFCVLTACQNGQDPIPKNYLRIISKSEPCWMDPRKGVSMTASPLHWIAFEGLMRIDEKGQLIPALAVSHTLSEDEKTYTFHLAKNARWSNGEALTARDFAESWKTMLRPEFLSKDAYLLYPIKNARKAHLQGGSIHDVGIYAKDAHTLVVELEHPHSPFLETTAISALVPAYPGIDDKNPDWAKDASEDFITNGPFMLKKWIHGSELVFAKNPYYYKKEEISLDGIWVRIVPSEMTYLRMYRKGEIDFLGSPVSPIPVSAFPTLIKEKKLQSIDVLGTKVLCFNVEDPLLKNRHVRRALNYAIDRSSIVNNLTLLQEEIATRALPQIITTNPQPPLFPDCAIALAKQELAKANLTKEELEKPIIFTYWGSQLNDLVVQHIQQLWEKELGLNVRLEKVTIKNVLAKIQSRSYQVSLCAFISEINHPINVLERFTSRANLRNYPGWECPEYMEVYEKERFNINRDEGFQKLETILMEEFPFAPLYHYKFAYIKSDPLENVHISYLGHPLFSRMRLRST